MNSRSDRDVRRGSIRPVRPVTPIRSTYPTSSSLSNSIITRRNRGVEHKFIDSIIGGCSANYR